MAENPFADLNLGQNKTKLASSPQAAAQDQGEGALWNFGESLLSAVGPEMVGRDPRAEVRQYRQEQPLAGGVSQFVGTAAPFLVPELLPLKAYRALPIASRGIKAAESMRNPVTAQALRQATKIGTFEAGRTGLTAATGGDVSEVAGEAAFNIAMDAAVAGGFRALSEAGPRPKAQQSPEQIVADFDNSFNLDSTAQEKLGQAIKMRDDYFDKMTEAQAGAVDKIIKNLQHEVRTGTVKGGQRYLQALDNGDAGKVGPLFRLGKGENVNKPFGLADESLDVRLATSKKRSKAGIGDVAETKDVLQRAGLTGEIEQNIQFPRYIRSSMSKASRKVEDILNENMQQLGDGEWIGREGEDGLFVMARKVGGEVGDPKHGDEFALFKTDTPDLFSQKAHGLGNAAKRTAFKLEANDPNDAILEEVPAAQAARRAKASVGEMSDVKKAPGANKENIIQQKGRKLLASVGGEDLAEETDNALDMTRRLMKKSIEPAMTQFRDNLRAAGVMGVARTVYDEAQARATRKLFGDINVPKGVTNYVTRITKPSEGLRTGGLKAFLDDVPDSEWDKVFRAINSAMDKDDAVRQFDLTSESEAFLRKLDELDADEVADFEALAKAFDKPEMFKALKNHRQFVRQFEGEYRVPMYRELSDGKKVLVGVGSGKSKKQALRKAEALQKWMDDEKGIKATFSKDDAGRAGEAFNDYSLAADLSDEALELDAQFKRQIQQPGRFEERSGVYGAIGDIETPSKDDFLEMMDKNIRQGEKWKADSAVKYYMADDMQKLTREDPDVAERLTVRLNQLAGTDPGATAPIDKLADRVLVPAIGVDAQKLSQETNKYMFHLTLGFGDVGFALLNGSTFVQTALPEAAYVMGTPPARVASLYDNVMVAGSQNVTSMKALSPMKMMGRAMRELRINDEQTARFFTRAVDDGTITPRMTEEFLGESSSLVTDWRKLLSGEGNYIQWFAEMSKWLPTKTEELSRLVSFKMGHVIGRDFLQPAGAIRPGEDALYQFAKRFTDRSMYRYATADRPRIASGAFGRAAGLFKNWMAHYISNTMLYAGEATRGNFRPLAWQMAGTFSLAGAGGSLGYGAVDSFNELMTDESAVESLYNLWGYEDPARSWLTDNTPFDEALAQEAVTKGQDFMYYGLPGLFGVSLQSRASVPGADVPRDLSHLFGIATMDRAAAGYQMFGSAMDAWFETGTHPGSDRQTLDKLMQFAAPRTVQNAVEVAGQKGVRSLNTGNTILGDVSTSEKILNIMGLQSTDVARSYEASSILWKEQEERRKAISSFGERIKDAREAGDYREATRLWGLAMQKGIPFDSLDKSVDAYMRKSQGGALERQFDEMNAIRIKQNMDL